ncbi:hypothetical protein [Marinospirillum perlucidum]|uniref:hypothetical protein n=1 Tax=Marinospirillum perlucidum TaxID=1982602 RepID=UPI000DF23273|nr:hypothetical protein [Marinospirillum perlucidum]
MKTWQLVLVQLWVLCFAPVWAFILAFAPLVLSPPNPSWVAFILLISPPFIAAFGSLVLWVARSQGKEQLQKRTSVALLIFPPVSVVPFFIGW